MSEAENISQEQGPIPVPPPTAAGMPTVPETTIIGMAPGPADLRMIVGESDFEMAATATRSPNDPLAQGESVNVATRINDRYRLKRLLGRGGYATVYEAWDEVLRRTVAIKVPRRERFSSRRQLDEFLTEAQTAARLKHRLIVTVHDVGWTPEGACFIVLDYVDGGTLTQALGKRRFTPHHAARLLADVAEAVSYANQQGLVHRDLKPSNILLDAAGQPYVADFGLATCDESPPLSSGEVVGTPPFMAPEQVRGENHRIDGRTDLWSLGVILYVLLTGRLPFEKEGEDYFQAILHREPIHPRRIDSQVPRELDRICMRCLAKRMTDRYATVADFAEELRSWLDGRTADDARPDIVVGESLAPDAEVSGLRRRSDRSLPRVRVVPKGLRSFGSPDADFFLELLPGPRDGDGLPESLRFWKQVFESTQPDNTSAVGLLYGPSGCGKSSFLKAGLIPRLAPFVVPLYVEATPDDFETRLLARLRREFPGLRADGGLAECWLALRDGGVLPPERKLVVIIDQFEQWLHAHRHEEDTELLRALRHCDGTRVQCLLAIRDDFGMAATRFMGDLEIPIVQGRNFATVDRFNPAHARKVLSDFGRAFGQLSGADSTWTAAEERFLEQAVESLMEDGKVIPVRLALFAEMVKDRDWNPQTLATMGGAEGVGVAFLEETFVSRSANPSHRRHHEAARRILGSLLPEQGTDIRGARVGVQQLRESSGYAERPRDFDDVLRILDSDLRLITPVEDQESAPGSEPPGAATAAIRQEPSYQLTHDYLVPSIRTWLTRAQRQTRRGRIELQLAEQAALWTVKPVSGLLPSGWIWLNALFLPRRPGAGEAQRRMMRAANRHYAILFAAAAVLLIAAATGTSWVRRQMATTADATHSRQLVQRLLTAEFSEAPGIIDEMRPFRTFVDPLLRDVLDHEHTAREGLHAAVALLPVDPAGQLPRLVEAALDLDPDRLAVLTAALAPHADAIQSTCWRASGEPVRESGRRLRAACLLAQVDPENPRWESIAQETVADLVAVPTLLAAKWTDLLRPARRWLVPPLFEGFAAAASSDRDRVRSTLAAALLAEYCDDAVRLAELFETATHEQFTALLPALHAHGPELIPYLEAAMARRPVVAWSDERPIGAWPAPSAQTVAVVERAHGVVTDRWALCQTLSRAEFDAVAGELRTAGYRPNCLRPYRDETETLIAAAWVRDGRDWAWTHDKTAAELEALDAMHREAGLVPFDIAAAETLLAASARDVRFTVLWVKPPPELIDAGMYVGREEEEHAAGWGPFNERGFVPRTNLLVMHEGRPLYGSVRWKFARRFDYVDCWSEPSAAYAMRDCGECLQADLRITLGSGDEPRYSAVWWDQGGWSSTVSGELPLDAHSDRCRELARDGFRPTTISVMRRPDRKALVAASSWQRPHTGEEGSTALARRQAGAALALVHLGRDATLWLHLQLEPDPTLRSLLIHGFAGTGVDARRLWERLETESDPTARRALLLGLARYPPAMSGATAPQSPLVEIVRKLYRDDPDSGVHSAALVLLRSLGGDAMAAQQSGDPPGAIGPGDRRWSQTNEGHTLAHVRGPVEFSIGSSAHQAHHESYWERQHRVRIPRSFAIGTTEVTVEQFLRFQPDFDYARDYAPEPTCPMTMVTYYDALRYCRWLSEQEGIAEDQMCYPRLAREDQQPVFDVPDDCLKRTGYRLPTEAEWEFACRAGTTASRPFGAADELLAAYAWTVQTSHYRSWPVARLLPNDLGLFDMLGNAMEFCQNTHREHDRPAAGTSREDNLEFAAFKPSGLRERRGGAFLYQPADSRSAHRDAGLPASKYPFMGFRIARTLAP